MENCQKLTTSCPNPNAARNSYTNWQLLHRHCPDEKTARENLAVGDTHAKRLSAEEPDAEKSSSPILEPSGGDTPFA